jgi:hypothetical protein
MVQIQGVPFILKNRQHSSIKSRGIARAKRHNGETVLFEVGSKESQFSLISRANHNLMIACFVVQGNRKEAASSVAKVVDGVVTTQDRIFKRKGDLVKSVVRYTHMPNKFLMGFGGKDNSRSPRAQARANPFVVKQDMNLFHDDLPLMWAIMRFVATNRRRGTSINAELETENREPNGGIKTVPILFDD